MRLGKLRFAYTPPVHLQHALKRHAFDTQPGSFHDIGSRAGCLRKPSNPQSNPLLHAFDSTVYSQAHGLDAVSNLIYGCHARPSFCSCKRIMGMIDVLSFEPDHSKASSYGACMTCTGTNKAHLNSRPLDSASFAALHVMDSRVHT
jgi:hypothetical protein